ncbi:hypothetical protein AMTRI_Chr05g60670 [Amborella trichopoda]
MQFTSNLIFSLIFFSKTNFLYKYPSREKAYFFRPKCLFYTQKSFWKDLTSTLDLVTHYRSAR